MYSNEIMTLLICYLICIYGLLLTATMLSQKYVMVHYKEARLNKYDADVRYYIFL